jgi:uncharacterized membrane protein
LMIFAVAKYLSMSSMETLFIDSSVFAIYYLLVRLVTCRRAFTSKPLHPRARKARG